MEKLGKYPASTWNGGGLDGPRSGALAEGCWLHTATQLPLCRCGVCGANLLRASSPSSLYFSSLTNFLFFLSVSFPLSLFPSLLYFLQGHCFLNKMFPSASFLRNFVKWNSLYWGL